MPAKKKVVVIGGGNGSACSINALKEHRDVFDIAAVISMSDSGGSSGRLRKEFNTLPMGDILRAVLAMSPYDYRMLKKIFNKNRFENTGKLDGHNLGNLFLALAEQYEGNFLHVFTALHQAVEAQGTAHPVTLETSDLCVELSNGDIIRGEHEIDRPHYDRSLRIKRAWLEPAPTLYRGAEEAVETADALVFGPGSLYCSVIATLAVKGMEEALRNTKARCIYIIGNAYEELGETGPTHFQEFVSELEHYLPRPLDFIVCNNHALSEKQKKWYREKQWGMITCDEKKDPRLVSGDFEKPENEGLGLSPQKLGKILRNIIA